MGGVMGESACAVGGSGLGKVDIAAVLRESVSFGRFMNETLEWGKWSSFNQNKYLEEAENYSTRGSVAQKKAYFEEHYKRLAARKAAERLGDELDDTATEDEEMEHGNEIMASMDAESEAVELEEALLNQPIDDAKFEPDDHVDDGNNINGVGEDTNSTPASSIPALGDSEDRSFDFDRRRISNAGIERTEELELEMREQKQVLDNLEIEEPETSEVEQNKANQFQKIPLKENNGSNLQMDAEAKASVSKPSFLGRFKSKSPPQSRKENRPGSGFHSKKLVKSTGTDRNTSKPNSLHLSINQLPFQKSCMPVEIPAPNVCKASDSKLNFGCFRAFQDFSGSRKTPTKDSTKGEPKVVPVTPQSEDRNKTPSEKTESTTKKHNSKWNSLLNRGRASCTMSTFFLRSEERAERRKEYFAKLEEKLNAEKLERQAKDKEKAENELKLLRQSLGFKARPLPKFYHKNEPPKPDVKSRQVPKPK